MTNDDLTPRQKLGLTCALAAVLCALLAAIPILELLSSTEFASDFESGTHTADYSGVAIAKGLAVATVVFAAVGVAIGNATARVIGGLILVVPTLVLMQAMVSR
ncbi:hypothetical protein [uncultured Williamsia sp.]|uniref:hypothetical protein n=1 Tax=uncultured Williamsia sp. TaxID=259311 RepID=UPI0026029ADD|nr:hypothetical protein [uncultured Williamsia sp.]